MTGAVAEEGRGGHGHVGPGQEELEHVPGRVWTPVVAASDRSVKTKREDGDPTQRQAELVS